MTARTRPKSTSRARRSISKPPKRRFPSTTRARAKHALLVEQIRENLSDIEAQLRQAEQAQTGDETDREGMQAETVRIQQLLTQVRARVEALHEESAEKRVAVAAQERELEAARREGERLRQESERLLREREARERERAAESGRQLDDETRLREGERDAGSAGAKSWPPRASATKALTKSIAPRRATCAA